MVCVCVYFIPSGIMNSFYLHTHKHMGGYALSSLALCVCLCARVSELGRDEVSVQVTADDPRTGLQ